MMRKYETKVLHISVYSNSVVLWKRKFSVSFSGKETHVGKFTDIN